MGSYTTKVADDRFSSAKYNKVVLGFTSKIKLMTDGNIENSLPEGWVETTLGECSEIVGGTTPSTKNDDFWNGNIPWITPKDLSGNVSVYIENGERNVTEVALENTGIKLLPENSVLFSSRAPIGYIAINKNPVTTNQGFKSLIPNEESNFKFLYYWLKQNSSNIKKQASGSTFMEVSGAVVRQIPISLPPLPEQKAIASALSSFDDKIELLREENKTLEATAQTIFKEWFGKYGVDDELPAGWRVGKMSDFGKIVCGKTPSKENKKYFDGKIPFIKIPDMHDEVFIIKTEDSLTELGANSQKNKFIPKNSVCVSCIATVGLVIITSEDSQTNQQINSIILSDIKYLEYLYFLLKIMKNKLIAIGSGGSTTLNINTTMFSNIEVIMPDKEIIKKYNLSVKQMFDKIKGNIRQIQSLSKTRDVLLPKLMKGEVRVEGF